MFVVEMADHGPFPRHPQPVHADERVQDPARCGGLDGLPRLGRKRLPVVHKRLAHARRSGGIAQYTPRHAHQQRHDALGLVARQRGGATRWGLQHAPPARGLALPFVAGQPRWRGPPRRLECMSRQADPAVRRASGLSGGERRRAGAWHLGDPRRGGSVLARSSPRGVARQGGDRGLGEGGGRKPRRNSCEGLVGLGCTGTGRTTPRLAGGTCRVAVRAPRRVHRALGGRPALRGVHQQPALRSPAIGGGPGLGAIVLPQRPHGRGRSVGEDRLPCTPGGWHPTAPLPGGSGALLAGLGPVAGPIGPQRRRARGDRPLVHRRADDRTTVCRIPAMATAGLHPHGATGPVFHAPRPQHLVESRPMLTAGATGERENLRRRVCLAVLAPIALATGAIERQKAWRQAHALSGGSGNETGEGGHPSGSEGLQGASHGSIVARLGIDTGGPQPRRRLVLKHPRDQGAVVIHDPQAVAHHGLDGTAHGDQAGCWGVRRRVGKNGADAECVAPPSDQTQGVQDVTARGAWQRFLLPRGDATGPLKLLKFDRATAEYRCSSIASAKRWKK